MTAKRKPKVSPALKAWIAREVARQVAKLPRRRKRIRPQSDYRGCC